MRRHTDATSPKKVYDNRNSRPIDRRYVSPYPFKRVQNILIGGIFVFSIGIMIVYSHLTEIEPNDTSGRDRMRAGITNSNAAIGGKRGSNLVDGQLRNNNNHRNPGRAGGSERGTVKCDQDISRLVSYWNDPRSDVDRAFRSPFLDPPASSSALVPERKRRRYLSFEPDCGGWNNIRMEFEIMVVLAAATGRILILPPDNPIYLLNKEKKNNKRGIRTFFQGFEEVVDIISMEEFVQREVVENKYYELPPDDHNRTRLMGSLQKCAWMAKSDISCQNLFEYFAKIADFVPEWHGEHHCLIMNDKRWFTDEGAHLNETQQQRVKTFCGARQPVYYNTQMHAAPLVHFRSHSKANRLLVHYYAFVHFTNPKMGNFYKRIVRDRVRYSDEIFCAAGKIVKSLIEESMGRYFNGAGAEAGYYSMHIRRGDFQWKKMRISAEEWHDNTKQWLEPDNQHLLYIATDEKDRAFFEPLMKHYNVRFLGDYSELANLSNIDPNFVGMIDQVVASRARDFVGTYFSSFSAYVGRMRGYHAISGKRMFYSHMDYWNETHKWVNPHSSYSSREYPTGWVGIDEDYEQSGQDFY